MNTFPILLGTLCVFALAYRYYSAFIAAKVLVLDDRRTTPSHIYEDGHNYVPSPKWVLFGHHFAAIAGAGPLVGPTLAAQFGFAPGFLWILIGAVWPAASTTSPYWWPPYGIKESRWPTSRAPKSAISPAWPL